MYIKSQIGSLFNDRISIKILADSSFYSKIEIDSKRELMKTGLGSSAALTTSLVGALLVHYLNLCLTDPKDLRIIEILANLSHYHVQNSIGSGFDISCAVYGSQVFTTYSKSLFDYTDVLNTSSIQEILNRQWDQSHECFQLPKGLCILMGDVKSGSNTPKMVQMVMNWTLENPEISTNLWNSLNEINLTIINRFKTLSSLNSTLINIEELSITPLSEWKQNTSSNSNQLIIDIYNLGLESLKILKLITSYSEAPIIPQKSLDIIYETLKLPGILLASVPGAGGYDAIYCICLSEECRNNVVEVWRNDSQFDIYPLIEATHCDDGIHIDIM
jgi:phosphomevalonate kinase